MCTQKVWKLKPPSSLAPKLAAEVGVTPLQAQLLINRGISDKASARAFLYPRLSSIADPMLFRDMDQALAEIMKAIEGQKRITIYGDYDADGVTATALLSNFFSSLQIPVSFYIPNRLHEGYGINPQALKEIAANGTGLIITVDCGISDTEEIALAQGLGMKVVVTDHHQVPEGFQSNCPVVNPHRPDCPFPFKNLAGVGLAFYLAVAVRTALRERGWFTRMREPDLREYLDLVALGTVADRVPLLNQNRILVHSGIRMMGRSRWTGLGAMMDVAGIGSAEITSDDLAFRLGPRLNAPGRMGNPEIAVHTLTVDKTGAARDMALALNAANNKRQIVERHILDQIEPMVERIRVQEDVKTMVMAGEDWHKGVLGIVASRIVDKYHRPCLVFTTKDGVAIGSGRSIEGFNLYRALSKLEHLLEKFGGHAYAAGVTLSAANLEPFRNELEGLARETLRDEDLVPTLEADAEIFLDEVTPEMIAQIRALSPYGEGNPESLFLARSVKVIGSGVVGDRHLKLRVGQGQKTFEAIGFGFSERHSVQGKTINILFTPELNRWQGYERIQLRIIDLEESL
jgi:single-stranded-DNA-specific exonuclease